MAGDPLTSNNGVLSYTLDPAGNRNAQTSAPATLGNQALSYDADDRLLSDTHDVNGNTTSSGINTFGYEFEDRPAFVTKTVSDIYKAVY